MKIPTRFIIAGKVTTLEFLRRRNTDVTKAARDCGIDLDKVMNEYQSHYGTIGRVGEALQERGVSPENILYRSSRSYTAADADDDTLVLSVGGDGELIDVARCFGAKGLFLGVKSNGISKGFLLQADYDNVIAAISIVMRGEFEVFSRQRARGHITYADGREVTEDALNEIIIADTYTVGFPRYEITHNNITEMQRSTGIIISSGTGSTGMIGNAALDADGKLFKTQPFPADAEELRYMLMIPDRQYKLSHGIISKGDVFQAVSHMMRDGMVSFDCSKPWYSNSKFYEFNQGAKIDVFVSPEPIKCVRLLK